MSLYSLMNLLKAYLKVYFFVLFFIFCCSSKIVPSISSILLQFTQVSSAESSFKENAPFLFVKARVFFLCRVLKLLPLLQNKGFHRYDKVFQEALNDSFQFHSSCYEVCAG